jgi:hypothetical protein
MLKSVQQAVRRNTAVRGAKALLRSPMRLRAEWRDRFYRPKAPHELAVCAIFKDEAQFLDEWITFHAGIGVTQFYLYNNGSRDRFREILRPHVARGLVSLQDWPAVPGQFSAYRDCLTRRWHAARWIAVIDIDEFLFSPNQVDIRPILQSYSDLPALFVHHVNFGSSGHQTPPPAPLVEAYTHCAHTSRSPSGKSIVNPSLVRGVTDAHIFPLWRGATRNSDRTVVANVPVCSEIPRALASLRLNHYWSRSIQDLKDKVRRGDVAYNLPRNLEQHLELERTMNETIDTAIIPIWRAITQAAN